MYRCSRSQLYVRQSGIRRRERLHRLSTDNDAPGHRICARGVFFLDFLYALVVMKHVHGQVNCVNCGEKFDSLTLGQFQLSHAT